MKNIEQRKAELREISIRTFYLISEITDCWRDSSLLISRAQSNGEKLVAQQSLEIIDKQDTENQSLKEEVENLKMSLHLQIIDKNHGIAEAKKNTEFLRNCLKTVKAEREELKEEVEGADKLYQGALSFLTAKEKEVERLKEKLSGCLDYAKSTGFKFSNENEPELKEFLEAINSESLKAIKQLGVVEEKLEIATNALKKLANGNSYGYCFDETGKDSELYLDIVEEALNQLKENS